MTHPFDQEEKTCRQHGLPKQIVKRETDAGATVVTFECPKCEEATNSRPAMRAPNEYGWSAFFDALAVPYKYEALEPDLSRALRYQPDFWLPDSLAWFEVKPERHVITSGEARVARLLVEATEQPVYIACGWPVAEKLQIRGYFRGFGEQWAKGGLAMVWLATLLQRRPGEVTRAGLHVMQRHWEFVRMWREAERK